MENLVKDDLKEQGNQERMDVLHRGTYCRMSRKSPLATSKGDHEYCHRQSKAVLPVRSLCPYMLPVLHHMFKLGKALHPQNPTD